jgi:hypothetical protein
MTCARVSNLLRRRSVRFKPSRAFERRLKPQSRAGLRSSGSRLLVEIDFVLFAFAGDSVGQCRIFVVNAGILYVGHVSACIYFRRRNVQATRGRRGRDGAVLHADTQPRAEHPAHESGPNHKPSTPKKMKAPAAGDEQDTN